MRVLGLRHRFCSVPLNSPPSLQSQPRLGRVWYTRAAQKPVQCIQSRDSIRNHDYFGLAMTSCDNQFLKGQLAEGRCRYCGQYITYLCKRSFIPSLFCDVRSSSFYLREMPSKGQLAHLKNARLASVEHSKKRKLERSQLTNTEQLCIDDDQLCTSDTSNTEDGKISGSGMRAQI